MPSQQAGRSPFWNVLSAFYVSGISGRMHAGGLASVGKGVGGPGLGAARLRPLGGRKRGFGVVSVLGPLPPLCAFPPPKRRVNGVSPFVSQSCGSGAAPAALSLVFVCLGVASSRRDVLLDVTG